MPSRTRSPSTVFGLKLWFQSGFGNVVRSIGRLLIGDSASSQPGLKAEVTGLMDIFSGDSGGRSGEFGISFGLSGFGL